MGILRICDDLSPFDRGRQFSTALEEPYSVRSPLDPSALQIALPTLPRLFGFGIVYRGMERQRSPGNTVVAEFRIVG